MKSKRIYIAKYTNCPTRSLSQLNEAVKDLYSTIYTEGLLMRYSAKPYDNLAIMRHLMRIDPRIWERKNKMEWTWQMEWNNGMMEWNGQMEKNGRNETDQITETDKRSRNLFLGNKEWF